MNKKTFYYMPIDILDLSGDTLNSLLNYNINTIGDLINFMSKKNLLSENKTQEIKSKMLRYGMSLDGQIVKGNIFDKLIDEVFLIDEKTEWRLKLNGICTVADLVKTTEEELYTILDANTAFKLILYMNMSNLPERPKNANAFAWLKALKEDFALNDREIKRLKGLEDELMQGLTEEEFDELLAIRVENLHLSNRSTNYLKREEISTLKDIVCRTVYNFKGKKDGEKCLKELSSKLSSVGLAFRPKDKSGDEWLAELKGKCCIKNLVDITLQENESIKESKESNRLDINEIPEKYRKTYAIGAGIIAKQGLNETSPSFIARTIEKHKTIDNRPIIKLNNSKEKKNEIKSVADLMSIIAEDISVIKELDRDFIIMHKRKLAEIVIGNANLSIGQRYELLEFINNLSNKNEVNRNLLK